MKLDSHVLFHGFASEPLSIMRYGDNNQHFPVNNKRSIYMHWKSPEPCVDIYRCWPYREVKWNEPVITLSHFLPDFQQVYSQTL